MSKIYFSSYKQFNIVTNKNIITSYIQYAKQRTYTVSRSKAFQLKIFEKIYLFIIIIIVIIIIVLIAIEIISKIENNKLDTLKSRYYMY